MKLVAKKPRNSFARGPNEVKRSLGHLAATRLPGRADGSQRGLGRLHAGPLALLCALGGSGIRHAKFEGDHATPAGRFRLIFGFFRADRIQRQPWPLPMHRAKSSDGWCDDPRLGTYNRRVALPCRGSHEKLWRHDHLYDLVFVLDYNIHPRRKNRGSAIFLHCARPDFAPTEGCIALRPDDLRRLLPRLAKKTVLTIR